MSKLLKSYMVKEYRQALDGVSSCVLVDVSPLKVGEVEGFRKHLRENDVRLRVVKNRLAFHAVEGLPVEPVREMFAGPTAIAYDVNDQEGIATVKTIKSYLQGKKKLSITIKGGFSEGEALGPPEMELLATTPDRPQLQAIMMGAILGPARSIAAATQGVIAGLARVIKANNDEAQDSGAEAGAAAEAAAEAGARETEEKEQVPD